MEELLAKERQKELDRQRAAYLLVISGDRVGDMIKVDREMTIGRGPEADYRLEEPGISRNHVRIRPEGERLVVEDLGSRNGSWVNGQQVRGPTPLGAGDQLRLGMTVILKFSSADGLEQQFQQRLFESAIKDPLTGLYNRRFLADRLSSEFSFSRRHGLPLTLALLDLDHFKQVNDRHGHPAGDAVLAGFGRLLREGTRQEDVLARYGGEEFAVLMRQTALDQGQVLIERLRARLAGLDAIPSIPGFRVTFSAGLAQAPDPSILVPDHLLTAADQALYAAKHGGRDRTCVYGRLSPG